ncbi:MAG: nucleotidyl transferase AbiEii/AbiGii toxin family protein [Hyphomicrobiaceae bacterium]|nr:nucleotidyl transferase AbiEii/AbiGii toxin family protein [Hyphomicrobiaceae bacterium]
MAKDIRNLGASVRARLLSVSQANGQVFDLVLVRFALERLIYRISQSAHADGLVLKGAMVLMTWLDAPHRATRDLDLLGFGDPNPDDMLATFKEILSLNFDDAVTFDVNGLRVDRIRDALEYGGLRLRTTAAIDGARVSIVVDIGFGDTLDPGVETVDYPVLLNLPAPRPRTYARKTVIAEKFQAMVALGRANTRMKDFYDIWVLSRVSAFNDDRLARAIAATFERRRTAIPIDIPDALSLAFAQDAQKQIQWRAFLENVAMDAGPLDTVIADLAAFLMPHARAAASNQKQK